MTRIGFAAPSGSVSALLDQLAPTPVTVIGDPDHPRAIVLTPELYAALADHIDAAVLELRAAARIHVDPDDPAAFDRLVTELGGDPDEVRAVMDDLVVLNDDGTATAVQVEEERG